jgi:hypothetical protein
MYYGIYVIEGSRSPLQRRSIFWGRDQTFSKNVDVEIIIDVFSKGGLTKVKNSTMSEIEHSASFIDISAAPAANKKILVSEKIHENAVGFAASKPSQMRKSDQGRSKMTTRIF